MRSPIPASAFVVAALLLSPGCYQRVQFVPGDECELNTNCSAPLVCRLGRCRVECRDPRDCEVGLACVRDESGLGACQLPSETECTLSSDCPDFLVCRFGQCTNACEEDRDCPAGSRCAEEPGEGLGCHDMANVGCRLNSECPSPYVCAVDRRCREECRTDRDCRDGDRCLPGSPPACGRPDAGTPFDASSPGDSGEPGLDASVPDAFVPDAFVPDAFVPDASLPDAGTADGGLAVVGPPSAPSIAAGLAHTCAAPTPGDLRCWGNNSEGQLGTGAITAHAGTFSLATRGLTDVTLVAAGALHTCVIEAGEVLCWGSNADGRLGTGSGMARHLDPSPVTLPAVPNDLTCGNAHTCAIADARLFCWGSNAQGQLGVGDTSARATPTEVPGLPATPVEVSAFGDHTCARLADGTVACFGQNADGQVGVAAASPVTSPNLVPGLDRVVQIMTGTTHTCALRDLGDVLCWGRDTVGQLGDGSVGGFRSTPQLTTPIPAPVLELGLGSQHACARTASAVYCWGDGTLGQLGYSPGFGRSATPEVVPGLGATTSLRAGTSHTCVWVGATEVRCFGLNIDGQLDGTSGGPGGATQVTVPWT